MTTESANSQENTQAVEKIQSISNYVYSIFNAMSYEISNHQLQVNDMLDDRIIFIRSTSASTSFSKAITEEEARKILDAGYKSAETYFEKSGVLLNAIKFMDTSTRSEFPRALKKRFVCDVIL